MVLDHRATRGIPPDAPGVIAGVPLTSEGMTEQGSAAANGTGQPRAKLVSPSKGIGTRTYLRGAIAVTRLKGKQDDFFSGWVVSADDGTSIEMRWNSADQEYVTEIKGKQGERIAVGGGQVCLFSPNGKTALQVRDAGIFACGPVFQAVMDTCVKLDAGMVLVGMGTVPPTPINACAVGVAGPVNVVSPKVFIGVV